MKVIVVLLALALTGCATYGSGNPAHDVIIGKQTLERIDYLTSPQGQRYMIEQLSTGKPIW